jgi:hypoxanthine phosphoribosyltransferase
MNSQRDRPQSYDYANRQGVLALDWPDFGRLAAILAEKLAAYQVTAVVGIARAGLFPATAVACMLRRELHPVRITRRINDQVVSQRPIWRQEVPHEVRDQVVAVVDEIADSGETLSLVAQRVLERGAARAVTASLVSHSWAQPSPDVVALVSDALVVFPWDARVYGEDGWQPHPEYQEALRHQRSTLP